MSSSDLMIKILVAQQKNGQKYNDIYFSAIYETNALLCSMSSFPQLLDTICSSRYENKVRIAEVLKIKQYAYAIIQELLYSARAASHFPMNPAGVILSLSILTHHRYLCISHIEKLKQVQNTVKEVMHNQGLRKHTTTDNSYIYTNPFERDKPAFCPKTIINIHGHKPDTSLYQTLKSQMEIILNMSNQTRSYEMNKVIETKIISDRDCKREGISKALTGQKGIYALSNIKKHTVVGFYTGIYIANATEQKKVFLELGVQQCGLYMFSFPKGEYPLISAYQYGNKICLVNASTTYEKSLQEIAKQYHTLNNIAVIYAKSGENPDPDYLKDSEAFDLVAYVSTKEIKKGEQLFVDYGFNYWQHRITTTINATQEEISKALRDYSSSANHKHYTFKKKK